MIIKKKNLDLPRFCRLLFVLISVRRPNLWPRSWRCLRTPACLADWLSAPSVSDHLVIVLVPYDNTQKQRHATVKQLQDQPRMWLCSTPENTTIFVQSNIFPLRPDRIDWLLLLRMLYTALSVSKTTRRKKQKQKRKNGLKFIENEKRQEIS